MDLHAVSVATHTSGAAVGDTSSAGMAATAAAANDFLALLAFLAFLALLALGALLALLALPGLAPNSTTPAASITISRPGTTHHPPLAASPAPCDALAVAAVSNAAVSSIRDALAAHTAAPLVGALLGWLLGWLLVRAWTLPVNSIVPSSPHATDVGLPFRRLSDCHELPVADCHPFEAARDDLPDTFPACSTPCFIMTIAPTHGVVSVHVDLLQASSWETIPASTAKATDEWATFVHNHHVLVVDGDAAGLASHVLEGRLDASAVDVSGSIDGTNLSLVVHGHTDHVGLAQACPLCLLAVDLARKLAL